MKKVLLLNNVPAPYFDPLFERLREDSGWSLTICYVTATTSEVGWGAQPLDSPGDRGTRILDGQHPRLKGWLGAPAAATAALVETLARERPDYLISYGYAPLPQAAAVSWAIATGTPYAVIGDANIYAECSTGLRRRAKGAWLRQVTRHAAALITVGTANRLFWESYGARPEQLYESRYVVDNDFFAREVARRREESARLRERMGMNGKAVFLYVGRLVERKGVDLLIGAARRLPGEEVGVIVAGDGPRGAALKELAGGDRRIVFAGRVAPADLPLYYGAADALVLAARAEPWGLVVNEAMACGLAVIAHRHCGATVDLVGPDNGAVLDSFTVEELTEAMRAIAGDDGRRRRMGEHSRQKIREWSIGAAARGIIRAVQESSRPRVASAVASELGRLK